jgi:UDP-glucose 4-epimerase
MDKLLEKTKIFVPKGYLDEESESDFRSYAEDLTRRGIELEEYCALSRKSEDDLRKERREHILAAIERTAAKVGQRVGVTIGALRLAPVLGPHVPSPLGRLLRMPAVPFSALADPPFAVIEDRDAARAFVVAARIGLAEPVNVVAPGAITALQAARRGGRLPLPLIGPDWRIARMLSHLAGAPIPDHVAETLHRGRLADNTRMRTLLGFEAETSTTEVIDRLYHWPNIIRQPARLQVA